MAARPAQNPPRQNCLAICGNTGGPQDPRFKRFTLERASWPARTRWCRPLPTGSCLTLEQIRSRRRRTGYHFSLPTCPPVTRISPPSVSVPFNRSSLRSSPSPKDTAPHPRHRTVRNAPLREEMGRIMRAAWRGADKLGLLSSSRRKSGPRFHRLRPCHVWVPAFAGMTWDNFRTAGISRHPDKRSARHPHQLRPLRGHLFHQGRGGR